MFLAYDLCWDMTDTGVPAEGSSGPYREWRVYPLDIQRVIRILMMAGHSSMYFTADTYAEVLGSDLTDAATRMGNLFGSIRS